MTRDSTFSYLHIDDPNLILYIEKWKDDPLRFDDIDTDALFDSTLSLFPNFVFEDEDDNNMSLNSSNFGVKFLKNKKRLLKEKIWNDLNLFEKLLSEGSPDTVDKTLLKSIYTSVEDSSHTDNTEIIESKELTMGEFLSNGYALSNNINSILASSSDMINDSMIIHNDIPVGSATYTNNSILGRSNSLSQHPQQILLSMTQQSQFQTPRMSRTRQPSTDKIFQTPITRIMR